MTRVRADSVPRDIHTRVLAENERLRLLIEARGPLRDVAKVYGELLLAEDPLRGRNLETIRGGVFDPNDERRPLPFQPTARYRAKREQLDRLLREAATAAYAAFDADVDAATLSDICSHCGSSDANARQRRSAVRRARDWLDLQIEDGPQEAAALLRRGRAAGHSAPTLRRASRLRPRLHVYQRGRAWWWQEPEDD